VSPRIWSIKVLIETDDDAVVEYTVDKISELLCATERLGDPDHRCDPPWFIVSGPMSRQRTKRWRGLLNR
jgi:hypothetical protein